jgi:hypothetical protein
MADFNSTEFAWKDIEVVMLGRPVVRILEVEYSEEVEKKHIYGRGSKPVGIQKGNRKFSGSLMIGQSELIALIEALGDPLANTFDISVSYRKGTDLTRDRICGVDLTTISKGMKQGDTDMNVKLPFMCMDVKHDV